jgi:methylisocitrate lyase
MGFAAVAWPVSATYAVAKVLREVYAALAAEGTTEAVEDRMLDFDEFNELVGLPALREAEAACDSFARRLVERREREREE